MKKQNGFTLIELLAVIIILGILMIIAIPSVTKYISDSRKSAYVDTAKEIITGARNLVNEGNLGMYDTNTTYYINSKCIRTENASKSPYGEFVKSYVVVTFDGKGYTYYWTSVDDARIGVKDIIKIDNLNTDNIESDIDPSAINVMTGVGNRSYIIEFDEKCKRVYETPVIAITNVAETGGNIDKLVYAQPASAVHLGSILTDYYFDYKEVPNYTTDPFEAFTIDESDKIKTISVCKYENNRVYCFTEDLEGSNYQKNASVFFQLYGTSSLYHEGGIVGPNALNSIGDGCIINIYEPDVDIVVACHNRLKKTLLDEIIRYGSSAVELSNTRNGYLCYYMQNSATDNKAMCYTEPQAILN